MPLFRRILFVCRQISTCFGPTGPSSGDSQSCCRHHWFSIRPVLVSCSVRTEHETRTGRMLNQWWRQQRCESPEDGPVGPKQVEIWRHTNKIRWNNDISCHFISYVIKMHGKRSLKANFNSPKLFNIKMIRKEYIVNFWNVSIWTEIGMTENIRYINHEDYSPYLYRINLRNELLWYKICRLSTVIVP
jgi:hypothetical protein